MANLERAIAIAVEAHQGQTDKAGAPYILHPLRVMLSLATTEERIAGVLHDVVEDSNWTFEALEQEGFSTSIIEALKAVTKLEGEEYADFVLRASRNAIGAKVKLADLTDNSDMSRIPQPTEKDFKRLEKYQRAIRVLTGEKPE